MADLNLNLVKPAQQTITEDLNTYYVKEVYKAI